MNKDIERQIDQAAEEFRAMLAEQYERNERMKAAAEGTGTAGAAGAFAAAGAFLP